MRTGRNITGLMGLIFGILALGWFVWNIGLTYLGLVRADLTVDQAVQDEHVQSEVFTLAEIRFWTCQIGVYSQRENAETALADLAAREHDLPVAVFSSDPWALGVGYASKPEDLSDLLSLLRAWGLEPYLKEVTIPKQQYRIEGQMSATTMAVLTAINGLLNSDYRSSTWEQTRELLEQRFKSALPWQLYPLRDEFTRMSAEDKPAASLRRIFLLYEYLKALNQLTIAEEKVALH